MSVPSIPTTYTHKLQPTAPFDVDVDTNLGGSFESKLAGGFDAVSYTHLDVYKRQVQ